MGVPWPGGWHWDWAGFGLGVIGTGPLLLGFWWLLKAETKASCRIRDFIENVLRPALEEWSVGQLLAISVLAAVCEEVLFRGVVQRGVEQWLGPVPGLILASALFGVCHWITPTYALVAGLMGGYLGLLWWWSGNLLTPVVTHAAYDFAALVWLLRVRRGGRGNGSSGTGN